MPRIRLSTAPWWKSGSVFRIRTPGKTPWFVGKPSVAAKYNLPNYPTDPRFTGGFYAQSINGYTQLGVQSSNPQFQNPRS